ncbi:hypothetical protein HK103_003540, partial [Boothiomyces macroporosus]
AFAGNFASKTNSIPRIDLSAGSAGELKYPSYSNPAAGYPTRGRFQAYSNAAVSDFRTWALAKYNNDSAQVAAAWSGYTNGKPVQSASDILPPCQVTTQALSSGVCAGRNTADDFYSSGYKSQYGQDFAQWYQGTLVKHAGRIAAAAHSRFDSVFGIPLNIKIAGVHWRYFDPVEPHSAERSAGYWDYSSLLQGLKGLGVGVTFTAIEMADNNVAGVYSGANTLAKAFFQTAASLGVQNLGGENALSFGSDTSSYGRIQNIITSYPLAGFTLLRYPDLINGAGSTFQQYVASLQYPAHPIHPGPVPTVTVNPQPTPTTAPGSGVSITVTGVSTQIGQSVKIAGNVSQLGNWNAANALPLSAGNCNGSVCVWTGSVSIPIGTQVQWKVIVTSSSGTLWECGNNNVLTVSSTSAINTGATFC